MSIVLWALAAGCAPRQADTKTDGSTEADAPAFEAPWEGLEPTDEVTAAFEAEVGDPLAGPGWFHTGSDARWGAEGAWARRERPTGASEDVLAVSIGGRTADGEVLVLQLVAAVSAWREGAVALDGDAATGVLARVEDAGVVPLAYLVGGEIEVDADGADDGDTVRGELSDVALAEVTP
ncbi:MAG: hypothetical protein ACOZNI_12425 [Myxococcota bacterium]